MKDYSNPYKKFLLNAFYKCIPINIQFELTRKCNLRCKFCYNDNANIFLDKDTVIKTIDDAVKLGSYMLSLTGGEPLIHPDFYEIALHGKKRGYLLIIQTNALIIDEKEANKIADLRPVAVDISLHGATEKTHDFITSVKGSFNKVMVAIKYLKELNCPIRLKVPITKYNQEEIDKIKEISESIGCYVVFDPFISPGLRGDLKPLDYKPDFKKLNSYIEYTVMDNEGDLIELHQKDLEGPVCGMGRTLVAISAEGDVRACMRIPISLGNIYNDSIINIWNKSEELKKLRAIKRGDIIKCRECNLLEYCFLCLGLQLLNNKDFSMPYEEACENANFRKQLYDKKKF